MPEEIIRNLKILKKYKYIISKQQYKTLKGQILKYDIIGFRKGLKKIIEVKNESTNNI